MIVLTMTDHAALMAVLLFLLGMVFGALVLAMFWSYVTPTIGVGQKVLFRGYRPRWTIAAAEVMGLQKPSLTVTLIPEEPRR